jgi:hypothetical protein
MSVASMVALPIASDARRCGAKTWNVVPEQDVTKIHGRKNMTYTNDWRRPTKRLNSVLLPTLGRPRMTQLNSSAFTGALFDDDDSEDKKGRGLRRKRSELTVVVMRRCRSEKLRMREMQQRCRGAAISENHRLINETMLVFVALVQLLHRRLAPPPPHTHTHTAVAACELPQSHVTRQPWSRAEARKFEMFSLKKIIFFLCFRKMRNMNAAPPVNPKPLQLQIISPFAHQMI